MSKSTGKPRSRKAGKADPKIHIPSSLSTPTLSAIGRRRSVATSTTSVGEVASSKASSRRIPNEAGWQEALSLHKAQADDLHTGRTPRPKEAQKNYRGGLV